MDCCSPLGCFVVNLFIHVIIFPYKASKVMVSLNNFKSKLSEACVGRVVIGCTSNENTLFRIRMAAVAGTKAL